MSVSNNTEKKDWVYIRPMGNSAVNNACKHSPNMFYFAKVGAWMIEKSELPTCHPDVALGFITDKVSELKVKDFQGQQVDATVRSSIGTCYSQELGEQIAKDREERNAQYAESSLNANSDTPVDESAAQTEKPKREIVYIIGSSKLNDALHSTPGIFFNVKNKFWTLSKDKLATAHPLLKTAHIYDSFKQLMTKQGNQISSELRETIGTKFDAKLGNEKLAQYKAKKNEKLAESKTNKNENTASNNLKNEYKPKQQERVYSQKKSYSYKR